MLYPPTRQNLELLVSVDDFDDKFVRIHGRLEAGKFWVTDETTAIYLPPGWIHGTFTLAGGVVPGIEFSSAHSLQMTSIVYELNRKNYEVGSDDQLPFLEACMAAFESRDQTTQRLASARFCETYNNLKKNSMFRTVLQKAQELSPVCLTCSRKFPSNPASTRKH